jgi:DNA transformation protein
MAASAAFSDFVADLFAPLGAVRVKRMFGGAGVYCGTVMFALIDDDVLYLKVDEASREHFLREGMTAFSYEGRDGRTLAMSYFALPERLYDEPDEALAWARRALGAAEASARKKPTTRKRTGPRRRSARKRR